MVWTLRIVLKRILGVVLILLGFVAGFIPGIPGWVLAFAGLTLLESEQLKRLGHVAKGWVRRNTETRTQKVVVSTALTVLSVLLFLLALFMTIIIHGILTKNVVPVIVP